MTTPALVSQADLSRAAKVANRHGCAIEIEAGNIKIRIIPNIHTDTSQGGLPIDEPDPVL